MYLKTALVMFVTCLVLAGCDRGPRSTRAAGGSESVSVPDRDPYEDRVAARLREFDHRFDGLEARLKGLDRADQDHLRVDIDELRARKTALKEKLDDLRGVSDQSWLDIKAALDRDLDQLEIAYNLVSANNHGAEHAPLNPNDPTAR
jgi:hypothetical protein